MARERTNPTEIHIFNSSVLAPQHQLNHQSLTVGQVLELLHRHEYRSGLGAFGGTDHATPLKEVHEPPGA